MAWYAVALLLLVTTIPGFDAQDDMAMRVCQAYYSVIDADSSDVRVDMVCCSSNTLKYYVCGFANGTVSGATQKCPDGQVFNPKTPEVQACVPASELKETTCENWIAAAEEKAAAAAMRKFSTEGTHGCIDCDIGPCHECLCEVAAKGSHSGVASIVDPMNNRRDQYLVCEGSRITCHPCPKGLVWDCNKQVCNHQGFCSQDIPDKCKCVCGIRNKYKKIITTETVDTITTVTTTAVTVTKDGYSYIKKFITTTTSVCKSTSSSFAGKVDVGCESKPPMSKTTVKRDTRSDSRTVASPKSVVRTTKTYDPCLPNAAPVVSVTKSCEGTCPPKATVGVPAYKGF